MATERKMLGYAGFVRHNPMTDKFNIEKFDHIEFWCIDAQNVGNRFKWGLGMREVAKSDLSTGNKHFASTVLKSKQLEFIFTSPYCNGDDKDGGSKPPVPFAGQDVCHEFVKQHGLAIRAVAIRVGDAKVAYEECVRNKPDCGRLEPTVLTDAESGKSKTISEVSLVGDVVLRWISGDWEGDFIPGYQKVDSPDINYGLDRIDHVVSNVPVLFDAVDHVSDMAGFHEFAEFVASDVGTVDSGLNSMVMSNNNEFILMPFNEPTFGTKRQSQIKTFLDHNNGAGVQHIALKTDDIFVTMREMRKRTQCGGFDFMPAPGPDYYAKIPERIGKDTLTADELKELQELGLLADKDDQGVLLQVFTRPTGDRPTAFMEIIQRIGCDKDADGCPVEQAAGCGGFGKGNFSELFKSIEEFERTLD